MLTMINNYISRHLLIHTSYLHCMIPKTNVSKIGVFYCIYFCVLKHSWTNDFCFEKNNAPRSHRRKFWKDGRTDGRADIEIGSLVNEPSLDSLEKPGYGVFR